VHRELDIVLRGEPLAADVLGGVMTSSIGFQSTPSSGDYIERGIESMSRTARAKSKRCQHRHVLADGRYGAEEQSVGSSEKRVRLADAQRTSLEDEQRAAALERVALGDEAARVVRRQSCSMDLK